MTNFRAVAAAAAATLALIPSAGIAQGATRGYYVATAASAPAKTSLVTRSALWKCADGTCVAAKTNARDDIVCQLVAREVGKLTAFRANGNDFDADALAACNAKAR